MPIRNLDNWNGGGKVLAPSKARLQEPIDALRDLARQVDSLPVDVEFEPQERFIAVVTATGPATSPGDTTPPYADARYWVRKKIIYGAGQNDPLALNFADDVSDPEPIIVTATNLSEVLAGNGHNLATDETILVECFGWWDNGNTSNVHYLFHAESRDSFGTLTTAWNPGDNTITLQPCKSKTDATSTGADPVTVSLQYPAGKPAVWCGLAVGDIAGYVGVGDGTFRVVNNPPPVPTLQYQVILNASSDPTKPNWIPDFPRAG